MVDLKKRLVKYEISELLEKGMSQFSPGTFLKTVLMPVLTRLQEKHEEMEWMILKSNAKMEREVRCEHEQLAREYENKGQARQARALLLMLSKKEQAEQERRQSQLQIMQMEIAPRSDSGFVGLKNLGCICYMNACLQQLFMTQKFREGILNAAAGTASIGIQKETFCMPSTL